MQVKYRKTSVSVTFPFIATVTLMLILCEEEIVLISVFSSFFHEMGHLLFLMIFSAPPSLIIFGAFGIRIERNSDILLNFKKEALVSLGGIFANCLLAVCGLLFYTVYNSIFGAQLFAVNVFIAAFNMLPVRLLDCGRFLECILGAAFSFEKSEKLMSVISLATVVFIVILCLLYNIFVSFNISFIAVCVYIILITTLKE